MSIALLFLEKVLLQITSILFLFTVFLALTQVFFRYVLNNALGWSEELTLIVFIWMSFLGSAVALSKAQHMSIDIIPNRFPEKPRLVINITVHIAMAVLLLVLGFHSIELVGNTTRILTGALRWPRALFYFPVLLGCAFMLVYCLRYVWESIHKLISIREV
jgi:TRAP-type C4-dicarboxylate transport system permease small subunit